MRTFAIALNTAREAIRNKLLYSILFFAVVVVTVAALFGSLVGSIYERVRSALTAKVVHHA